VRKFLIALLGALVLQLGLVQAAVADDTTTSSSTPAPSSSTTTSSSTPAPSSSTTTSSSTPAPSSSTTTTTTPGGTEPQTGVFDRRPASGPVQTVIAVKSITPCVPPQGASSPEVEVVLFNERDLQQGVLTIDELFQVNADGTWSGKVTVPADAALGQNVIVAACFASPTDVEPFLIYQPQGFTVTAAAVPPPAPPGAVSENPTFVG